LARKWQAAAGKASRGVVVSGSQAESKIDQSKTFFSEEKKQKTFEHLSKLLQNRWRKPNKIFLVLFFKKEPLPFPEPIPHAMKGA
jgi:hypothetical protein